MAQHARHEGLFTALLLFQVVPAGVFLLRRFSEPLKEKRAQMRRGNEQVSINEILYEDDIEQNGTELLPAPVNVPWFYQLCDELGLYVIDEADNESHGTEPLYFREDDYSERMRKAHVRIADNPDFIEPTLDRIRSIVIRNRNRPCILVWSMGNECGYGCTFEKALRWTKETDPARLTHYESAFYLSSDRAFDTSDIDLFGRMYPGFSEITDYLDNSPEKPLLLVEYCHSMGNSPGDLKRICRRRC